MSRRFFTAIAVASLIPLALFAGPPRPARAASAPTVVLYPRTFGNTDDLHALIAVRQKLRDDGALSVLTYDPDSPAVKRAAADAQHPEWLTGTFASDGQRRALARALGVAFLAVVSHANGRDKIDVQLSQPEDAGQTWSFTGQKANDAAVAIEKQAADTPVPAPAPVQPPAPVASPSPVPAPVVPPTPVVTVTPPPDDAAQRAVDLANVEPLLSQGDAALARSDIAGAISDYRQAINAAPLNVSPRLKLADAYLQGGMRDKALDEAKRALEIAPSSVPAQEFLIKLDADSGSFDGAVARYQALVDRNPQDASAHLGLGDALRNSGSLTQAEDEYKAAQKLAAPGDHAAAARLARLYAAQSRYDAGLAELSEAGADGYPLALEIIESRADNLIGTLGDARDAFAAGKKTHEEFYDIANKVSTQAQDLADFVAKITPPPSFKLSHAHRVQATQLLAQEASVLVTYIETSDSAQSEKAALLEKSAQTEMLTAHDIEQKQGLWQDKT